MLTSFLRSVLSRGLKGNRVSLEVKIERIVSCHGDGVDFEPCQYRAYSDRGRFHYCDQCGCGEKKGARLSAVGSKPDDPLFDSSYDKLDYPYLECPIGAPGFNAPRRPMPIKPSNETPPLPTGPEVIYAVFSGGLRLTPTGVIDNRVLQLRRFRAHQDGTNPVETAPMKQIQLRGDNLAPEVIEFNGAIDNAVQKLVDTLKL